MRSAFLCLAIIFALSTLCQAQLSGTVYDENGLPLPYVNVYVKNTSIGTTTNPEGKYVLELVQGEHEIVYQFIGYKNENKFINITDKETTLDLSMKPESYTLVEVTINADAEDPAYAIIRKAQEKRKYYKELLDNYECDAYVRGFNKVIKAPEKVLGIEVGDFEGALDSNRTGVVYLSESISKLYYKEGQAKEILYSSKVSGNDQGYSFNSAREMDLNLYSNTVQLNSNMGRKLVSPIANNAMSHYKYKLEGATYDSNGQLVNKIKVTPKNKYGNAFSGYVYINENLWNFHSLELDARKEATQIPFLDTLSFKQIYAPLDDKLWIRMSNVANFSMGAFGFGIEGSFACVYSNYNLGEVEDNVFNNEIFKVEKDANERTDSYWDTIRPIPLTLEEKVDYRRKDSIKIVRESPAFLDSIDRAANKFKFKNLILGYTKQNSFSKTSTSISSILGNVRLNTIQGWNSTLKFGFDKRYNKAETKSLKTELALNYGLSEKVIRPRLSIAYQANWTNNLKIETELGKKLSQYSRTKPIKDWVNSLYTLLSSRNYLKAYDKEFFTLKASSDLFPGVAGGMSIDYENRSALTNHYLSDTRRAEKNYSSNNPLEPSIDNPAFEDHQAFIFRAHLIFNIGQKVWSYPDWKFKMNSGWPTIGIYYKSGLEILGGDAKYHLLYTNISKRLQTGIYGQSNFRIKAGSFLGAKKPEYFIDYYHPNGNQTHLGFPREYSYCFLDLPYYSISTDGEFFEVHAQHNFEGYIMSKIPFLKKLQWQLVGGYKFMSSSNHPAYQEVHVGLDNLGIKAIRLFRLDLVWSRLNCQDRNLCDQGWKPALVFGLKLN